ncbi:hypothetical protein ACFCP7_26490 [Paenibacillus elgii]
MYENRVLQQYSVPNPNEMNEPDPSFVVEVNMYWFRTTDGDWKMEGNDSSRLDHCWDGLISKDGYELESFTDMDKSEVRKLLEARLSAMNAEDVEAYGATNDPASLNSGRIGMAKQFKETKLYKSLFTQFFYIYFKNRIYLNELCAVTLENVKMYGKLQAVVKNVFHMMFLPNQS